MIYVLHGEDTASSYKRIDDLLNKYPNYEKIWLIPDKDSQEKFNLSLYTESIFDSQKILLCESLISSRKIVASQLKKIPKDKIVIFWEKSKIASGDLKKLGLLDHVEEFKLPPILFYFLDSISYDSIKTISYLEKLEKQKDLKLTWQLSNRILLLILAKLGSNISQASKVTGKKVEDWQWKKIIFQAKRISLDTLYSLFDGVLKIESLIKTGATNLSENTLVSLLIIKYLKVK